MTDHLFSNYGVGTASVGPGSVSLSLADVQAAAKKLEAIPKGKWMLVTPYGTVYADEDPHKLLRKFIGLLPLSVQSWSQLGQEPLSQVDLTQDHIGDSDDKP